MAVGALAKRAYEDEGSGEARLQSAPTRMKGEEGVGEARLQSAPTMKGEEGFDTILLTASLYLATAGM